MRSVGGRNLRKGHMLGMAYECTEFLTLCVSGALWTTSWERLRGSSCFGSFSDSQPRSSRDASWRNSHAYPPPRRITRSGT